MVTVRVPARRSELGSGFIVTADGYIITNDHVVAGGTGRSVTWSSTTARPRRRTWSGTDPESDLAVLKVDPDRPARRSSSATRTRSRSATRWSRSARRWRWRAPSPRASSAPSTARSQTGDRAARPRYYAAIQTDAAVNHGNSGGPLFDTAGRVDRDQLRDQVAGADEEEAGNIGIAFAIPINQASRVAQEHHRHRPGPPDGHRRRDRGVPRSGRRRAPGAVEAGRPGGRGRTAGRRRGHAATAGRSRSRRSDRAGPQVAPGAVVTSSTGAAPTGQNAAVTLAADAK